MIGIYKITSPTGKIYIGQSWRVKERHDSYRRLECSSQPKLYNSLRKYSWEAHQLEILCEFSSDITQETLDYFEIIYHDWYKELGFEMLNTREPGKGGKISEETKIKMRKPKPKGFGERISQTLKGKSNTKNKGKKRTEQQVLNMSNALKGKKQTRNAYSKLILEEVIEKYETLSSMKLAEYFEVSMPLMLEFLKSNKIYQFRKNYE